MPLFMSLSFVSGSGFLPIQDLSWTCGKKVSMIRLWGRNERRAHYDIARSQGYGWGELLRRTRKWSYDESLPSIRTQSTPLTMPSDADRHLSPMPNWVYDNSVTSLRILTYSWGTHEYTIHFAIVHSHKRRKRMGTRNNARRQQLPEILPSKVKVFGWISPHNRTSPVPPRQSRV